MLKMWVSVLIALLFAGRAVCFSQEETSWKNYAQSIDCSYKLGFLIAHRESMAHLPKSHFQSFEVSYNWHSRGYNGWEQANNNPVFGLVATAVFNANREVLGNAYGLAGRVTLPKIKWGRVGHWMWSNNVSFGLGYLERKFDLTNNPKNIAIGSHLNLLIILGTSIRYNYQNTQYTLGLDFTHFSNGGTVKPNLGLNIPSLKIGVSYTTKSRILNEKILDFDRNDLELLITAIGSAKNNYDFEKRVYPMFGLSAHLSKAQGRKYRYLYGLDLIYSEANRHFLNSEPNQSVVQTAQFGIYNGWELDLNRFVFSIGMGIYAYNPLDPHGWFYHRIGGRIFISEKIFFHGYVRSHWAKADFFECGISYKFRLR